MKTESIHYGKLPLNVRLAFLLIGFSGLSAIFHAVSAVIYQLTFNVKSAIPFWLAIAVTIGAMSSLKKKTLISYKKAIILLLSLPAYYALIAFTQTDVPDEAYKLIYSWPLFNTILFFACIVVIANKSTYQFYCGEL
jgi:hypothetical protein